MPVQYSDREASENKGANRTLVRPWGGGTPKAARSKTSQVRRSHPLRHSGGGGVADNNGGGGKRYVRILDRGGRKKGAGAEKYDGVTKGATA